MNDEYILCEQGKEEHSRSREQPMQKPQGSRDCFEREGKTSVTGVWRMKGQLSRYKVIRPDHTGPCRQGVKCECYCGNKLVKVLSRVRVCDRIRSVL